MLSTRVYASNSVLNSSRQPKRSFSLSGKGVSITSKTDKIVIEGSGSPNYGAGSSPNDDDVHGEGSLHVISGHGIWGRGITSDGEICAQGSIRSACDVSAGRFQITTNDSYTDGFTGGPFYFVDANGDTCSFTVTGGIITNVTIG